MASVDLGRYKRIVQLLWDPEPLNDQVVDQPVWLLGCRYTQPGKEASHATNEDRPSLSRNDTDGSSQIIHIPNPPETPPDSASGSYSSAEHRGPVCDGGWPPAFLDDFESRFWMTYRSDFPPIARSQDPRASSALSLSMRIKSQLIDQNGFTSDSGWGCMIRSGQSLLANAMSVVELGREWRRGTHANLEKGLLSRFADDPRAPYSIHNFVRHGAMACGKFPGEWFGPSATARCIQSLVNDHNHSLRIYNTGDTPDVFEDDFLRIAKPPGRKFRPTLILVGTRLGIDKVTPVYWEALIAALQMPQSVGIAGGRPSSSHYFIGSQGLNLFYLDPHHTRTALAFHQDPDAYSEIDIDTCHTRRLRRLHVREMDPSMLIAFLIKDEADWAEWRSSIKHVQGKAVVSVIDHDPASIGAQPGRPGAIDEVSAMSDDDDETVLGS